MKTVGIIAEYNPFHNGHYYHASESKTALDADCVVAVMSGNFTQRGEIALFDMYSRADIAVKNGVDLVLEIPPQFVLNSAEFYAFYSVYLLQQLGVIDYLSFGSECGSLDLLKECEKPAAHIIKKQMKTGIQYGKAISDSEVSQKPNNILGIEYLRALKKIHSDIVPFTVKRRAVEHGSKDTFNSFASASWIRKQIYSGNKKVSDFLPELPQTPPVFEEALFPLLKYRLIMGQAEELSQVNNISEGLQNRIIINRDADTFVELIDRIKCKRYPETRIRRAIYSLLLNLEKNECPPTYTRVLAYNENGRKILREIRRKSQIPVFSRITKKDVYQYPQLQKELYCNEIYELAKNKLMRGITE